MSKNKKIPVFDGSVCKTGFYYRIPSIIRRNNGDLLAFADERVYSNKDNPNLIHKVMRVSHDSGQTWEEKSTIVQCSGTSELTSTAAIDAAVLYDSDQDALYMIYCFTPAGIGLYNSERSIGSLKEPMIPTSYLMLTKSVDGGKKWSEPVCLNSMVKSDSWAFIGACPGIGIKLKNKKFKNRFVFPIYYSGNTVQPSLMARVIYSDDGVHWMSGEDIVDYGSHRKDGIYDSEELMITESQIVEVGDRLVIYCRNHSNERKIGVAESVDGGVTWNNFHFIPIDQPICQISALKFSNEEGEMVLLANPCSKTERVNGTIHCTVDGGQTYQKLKMIVPDFFSYSCMVQIDDERVGVLYEDSFESIKFIQIKIEQSEER